MSLSYGGADMVFAEYGPHLRNVRALCAREILSKNTLDSFSALRKQEIQRTLRSIYAKVNSAVDIRQEMYLTMLNVIMNMLWGGTHDDEDRNRIGAEFGRLAEEMINNLGRTNISDFFPVLAKFDLQGIDQRMKELISWLDTFFESLIDKRVKMDHELKLNGDENSKKNEFKDFLQVFQKFKTKVNPKLLLPQPTSRLCL
ncbi:cytochrome P450 93A3-like isoform X2 [Papaver somniferum]|uniref:cytochrome P450 93A3-like isoform X2 n=1 Tax=Papaver somniferum TaxID=3469 RepID=UPI000E702863|nr:cytochrome P450 93A3-like isoform X2 [Papaver somniferum]